MKLGSLVAAIALSAWAPGSSAVAEEVTVQKTHLCCKACVEAVEGALAEVEGVSNTVCDRKARSITFTTENRAASEAGIQALADAGFCGQAAVGEEKLKYPKMGVKKGTTSDNLTLTGVHLCCGACVSGAKAAIKDVEGISEVKASQDEGTIQLTGTAIDIRATLQALRKGGFFASVKDLKPDDTAEDE